MRSMKLKLNIMNNFKFYVNENEFETDRIGPEKYDEGMRVWFNVNSEG